MTPDMTARMVDGWAMVLVHSLWIGSAAALIVAALLQRLPAHRADLRAGVAFAGLLLSLIGSIAAPFISQPLWRAASEPVVAMTEDASYHDSVKTSAAVTRSVDKTTRRSVSPSPPSPQTSWRRAIVGAWLIGVAISLVRLGRSHIAARRLVRSAAALENRSLEAILDEVARALGVVTRATIKVTDRVATPLVYGFWSPVILLPVSLVTGAAPETLRVVLAHELWHLRRGDLWQTVAQRLVEAVLFYHPAVWWLSRQTEREREAACDAAAARVVGDGVPVATALLDVASLGVTTPAAAMGFGGGSLAERVQRLLRPSEQPRVRVAWGGLLAMSMLSVAALVSLTAGTGLVAREVVVAMTPAERVVAIEQAIAEYASNSYHRLDPRTGRLPEGTPLCRVKGKFVAWEGDPLPEWSGLNMTWPGMSKGLSTVKDGAFSVTDVPQGVLLHVQPHIDGYAFEKYGPFAATGETVDLGEIKLTRGFTAQLMITDENDEPLAGASIVDPTIWIKYTDGSSRASGYTLSYLENKPSDSAGVIELDRLVKSPIELTIQKAGYERLRREITFVPGGVVTAKLRPSSPTTGRFVDEAGNPVVGVEVHCVTSSGDQLGGNDPRSDFLERLDGAKWGEKALALSDEEGKFQLASLKEGATYAMLALHKDHQPVRLDEVRSGESLGDILAPPPLEVRGRVVNTVDANGQSIPGPLFYSNSISYPFHRVDYESQFRTLIEDEGRFVIRQLLPGRVSVNVGKHRFWLDITHSLDDFEIDLEQSREWEAENLRLVKIRIEAPNHQPVRGEVYVVWRIPKPPRFGVSSGSEFLKIPAQGDAVVELRAPIGAELQFSGSQLIGAYTEQQSLGVVPPGEGPYEAVASVEPAGLVVGQVVDARGAPLPNCTVRVRRVEGPPSDFFHGKEESNLSSRGRFSIGPLPLGEDRRYDCEVQVQGTQRFVTSEPFQVTAANPIHDLTLTMPDPVYLTGQVLDHRGKPASRRSTALSHMTSTHHFAPGIGPVDDDGRFRIAITPGPSEDKFSLQVLPANGSAGVTLRYAPGWSRRGKDFGVVRLGAGSIIRGVVTTEDGKPAVGLKVSSRALDAQNAAYDGSVSTETNQSGEFQLEGVERVPQKVEVQKLEAGFPRTIKSVEPASALSKERYGYPYLRVTPTDEPTELRIIVSDEK